VTPGTTKRDKPLSPDEIFAAALVIIDAGGLDALSMRALARALRVEAMALYHHVESKDAIIDGVVALVLSEMSAPDPLPGDWMELLESMLVSLRVTLAAHPNVIPLVIQRPPRADTYVQAPVIALARAGFTDDQVEELFEGIMAFTFGNAILGTTALSAPGAPPPAFNEQSFRKGIRFLLGGYARELDAP
jgi:AcrR family transcriptional regulator